MTRFGVDFAYGWKPGLGGAFAAEGVTAIGRYCPYQGDGGKGLTIEEVIDYHANGLEVFLFWEQEAAMHRGGFSRGKRDAEIAIANLRALGAPDTVAIYPAVDFNPLASDWPLIRDYQRGFISVAGIERTGIYGNYDVVEYAKQMGLAAYFCQCVAWSDGELNPWRHIYQDVGPNVAGIHVDHLTIYGDEFGQWRADAGMTDRDILAIFGSTETDPAERLANAKYRYEQSITTGNSPFNAAANALANLDAHVANHPSSGGTGVPKHTHEIASAVVGDPK